MVALDSQDHPLQSEVSREVCEQCTLYKSKPPRCYADMDVRSIKIERGHCVRTVENILSKSPAGLKRKKQ